MSFFNSFSQTEFKLVSYPYGDFYSLSENSKSINIVGNTTACLDCYKSLASFFCKNKIEKEFDLNLIILCDSSYGVKNSMPFYIFKGIYKGKSNFYFDGALACRYYRNINDLIQGKFCTKYFFEHSPYVIIFRGNQPPIICEEPFKGIKISNEFKKVLKNNNVIK